MLPSITILGIELPTYHLMTSVGIVVTYVLLCMRAKRYQITVCKAALIATLLSISNFLLGKSAYIILNFQSTLKNGIGIDGMEFFGVLLGLPLVMYLLAKFVLHMQASDLLDAVAPIAIALILCVRFGCYMSGCCQGIVIGTFQIPVQLIEACLCAILLMFLLYCEEVNRFEGKRYPVMMLCYGSLRFVVEFLRIPIIKWFGISHWQVFAILSVIIAIAWISLMNRRITCETK